VGGDVVDQVGTTIAGVRRAAGLSAAGLARAVHVSRPTVVMWERGGCSVPRHHWPRLAAALGLGLDEVAELLRGRAPGRLDGVRLPSLGHGRRAAGLRQRDLADRLGVAVTTVSTWETTAARVPLQHAESIADLLGAPIARLRSGPPPEVDTRPLRALRLGARMHRREAACHLGVALTTLARYEAGTRQPPVAVLRRMADLYGQPVDVLLRHGPAVLPLPPAPWQPDDLPVLLLALRTRAGLTKADIGRRLGRTGQAVRSWEVGRARPTSATCRRLELMFRLPPGSIPDREAVPAPAGRDRPTTLRSARS